MKMKVIITILLFNVHLIFANISYKIPKKPVEHWNVTQWWKENNDFDDTQTEKPIHFDFKEPPYDERPDYYMSSQIAEINAEETSFKSGKSVKPRTSTLDLRNIYNKFFTNVRSHRGNRRQYRDVQKQLKQKFIDYGLETAAQSFWPPEMHQIRPNQKAQNIIGILPGTMRGIPNKDEIIIIGGHYDTVRVSPGIEDNGSGSTAVMEIARLLTSNKCKFTKTIIFVLFDMEEDGLKGSKHFVSQYLIPVEIEKNKAKMIGAILMDMVLVHETTPGSQSLASMENVIPDWASSVKQNQYRGDFAAIWARKGIDTRIYYTLKRNWLNGDKYKLSLMAPALPKLGVSMDESFSKYTKYDTFFRSDHASFWYPSRKDLSFNAVLITDLGPWRRSAKDHYHRKSDDRRLLNENNLNFLKNIIDSVIDTLLDVGDGKCII